MAKVSPQKRYANAVHIIAKRAKVSYRSAQRIYRNHKDKYPSHWQELPKKTVAEYRAEVTGTVYDLTGKDRPFAFDVKKRKEGRDAEAALSESGLQRVGEATYKFTVVVDGKKKTVEKKRSDISVKPDDFWYAMHDAAREVLEDEIAEGYDYDAISIVLDTVGVV